MGTDAQEGKVRSGYEGSFMLDHSSSGWWETIRLRMFHSPYSGAGATVRRVKGFIESFAAAKRRTCSLIEP